MKKLIIIFAFISTLCTFTFIGCKKGTDNGKQISEQALEKAKAATKALMIKNKGREMRYTLNKRMQVAYCDLQGNLHNSLPHSESIVSTCANDAPNYIDFNYYSFLYDCHNSGYLIKFGYTISWNNNVVGVSPFNALNLTKAKVNIVKGTTKVYDESDFYVSINDMGSDPTFLGSEIFLVEFTSKKPIDYNFLSSQSGPTPILRLGATFASDCSSLDKWGVAPMDPNGKGGLYYGELNSTPTTRNDKCFFLGNGPGNLDPSGITIAGYDVTASCPTTGIVPSPDYSEVEYRLNPSSPWLPFQNKTSPYPVNGNKFLTFSDFGVNEQGIPSGTYDIQIRYRNITLKPSATFGDIPYNDDIENFHVPSGQTANCDVNRNFYYEIEYGVVIP